MGIRGAFEITAAFPGPKAATAGEGQPIKTEKSFH